MFTRKESDNEFVDRKQVDDEEEALKRLYERGDGGAADGGAADGEIATTGKESTETPSSQPDCFSKTAKHGSINIYRIHRIIGESNIWKLALNW